MTSPDLKCIDYLSRVAANATLLPIDPASVEIGISTSGLCSPAEPQGMEGTSVCTANPTVVPSMEIAWDEAASRRDIVRLTRDDEELPGQSTLKVNRVEITNDPAVFWLVSPGAEVPLK